MHTEAYETPEAPIPGYRHHAAFRSTCIQLALRGSNALDLLSTLSMYTIMFSIFIGLLVTAYVRLKKDQIFDPLSSELDEE